MGVNAKGVAREMSGTAAMKCSGVCWLRGVSRWGRH